MTEHEASRTLVKSPPELWAECSDAASLARHLGPFGDIQITQLEPETAVAWEGERVSGTVRLEPSGWGTKVVLTATPSGTLEAPPVVVERDEAPPEAEAPEAPEAEAPEAPEAEAEAAPPEAAPEAAPIAPAPREETSEPAPRMGFFARLRRWMSGGGAPEPVAEPAPVTGPPPPAVEQPPPVADQPPPVAEPPPVAPAPVAGRRPDPGDALTAALDSLGQAHHRPYSRS